MNFKVGDEVIIKIPEDVNISGYDRTFIRNVKEKVIFKIINIRERSPTADISARDFQRNWNSIPFDWLTPNVISNWKEVLE